MIDLVRLADRVNKELGIRAGWPEDRDLPFPIRCPRLSRLVMGDREFEREFRERKGWCAANCEFDWDVSPMRDKVGRLIGREFRFENEDDALIFFIQFV
jgi:hypothetical protein